MNIFIDLIGKHMRSDMQVDKRIKLHEGHEDFIDDVEAVCSSTPSIMTHMWDVFHQLIINRSSLQAFVVNGGAAFEFDFLVHRYIHVYTCVYKVHT